MATAPPKQSSSPTARLKALAINTLLVLVSTLLSYLVLEIVFYRVLLPDARFSPRPFLPETPGVLVQTTKAGYVPHDYVAILADSYAHPPSRSPGRPAQPAPSWRSRRAVSQSRPMAECDLSH